MMSEIKIIDKIASEKVLKSDDVIYGVYNNVNMPWDVRLNDFFIDHSKITLKDKSYFFHMLAVMVNAGIPLVKALKALSKRTENKRFARILNTIAYNTEQGLPLADSMLRFEDVFDEFEVGIVRSGESIGRLDEMLFKLSAKLDNSYELSQKLWSASVYPLVVFGVLLIVAFVMMFFVFPTLIGLFQEGGLGVTKLPLATRLLVFLQNTLLNYWWAILLIIGAFYLAFLSYIGTDSGRVSFDIFKLKIPYLGALLRKIYVLRFVDMLAILVDAGVPVVKVLEIVRNSMSNTAYRAVLEDIALGVKNGEKISYLMGKYELLFPLEVVEMIKTGEASASISKVSEKISLQYQKEVDFSLKKFVSVFEPMMIVFVGLFVAVLALAIMGPIFNLSSSAL
jgi:type II secretory pathway component PulF